MLRPAVSLPGTPWMRVRQGIVVLALVAWALPTVASTTTTTPTTTTTTSTTLGQPSEVYPILRQFWVQNKLVSAGWDRVLL